MPTPADRLPDPPPGLRHWRDDAADRAALTAAWHDPAIARFSSPPPDVAPGRWLAGAERRWRTTGAVDLVVRETATAGEDACIGEIGLRNRSEHPARAELSVWLLPAGRGRGVAGVAVPSVVAWAGTTLGLTQVWARVHPSNTSALALFDRLGWDDLGAAGVHRLRAVVPGRS